jgi:hypothetical protein
MGPEAFAQLACEEFFSRFFLIEALFYSFRGSFSFETPITNCRDIPEISSFIGSYLNLQLWAQLKAAREF